MFSVLRKIKSLFIQLASHIPKRKESPALARALPSTPPAPTGQPPALQAVRQVTASDVVIAGGSVSRHSTHIYYSQKPEAIQLPGEACPNLESLIKGTGKVFLGSHDFQGWLEGRPKILVGVGIQYSLAAFRSAVVRYVQKRKPEPENLVTFVFCHPDDRLSVEAILAALLRQVLERHSGSISPIWSMYSRCVRELVQPDQEELSMKLKEIWGHYNAVFLIVDGLHNVRKEVQRDLLDVLSKMAINLFDATTCRIQASKQDIHSLVMVKLRAPGVQISFPDTTLKEIAGIVWKSCEGMFLHAHLQLEALKLGSTEKDVQNILQSFPSKIEHLYREILSTYIKNQSSSNTLRAKQALLWIVYARRHLTLQELQFVLATDHNTLKYDPDNVIDEGTLLSACCGLVTLVDTSGAGRSAHLVHPTAELVLRELFEVNPTGINHHDALASSCMAFLLASGVHKWNPGQPFSDFLALSTHTLTQSAFLPYAHDSWSFHARLCGAQDSVKQFLRQCVSFPVEDDYLGPLHLAAYHNLAFQDLVLEAPDCDARTPVAGKTALMLAAGEGHAECVEFLLDKRKDDVDVNATDNTKCTALMHASRRGHSRAVEILLQYCSVDLRAVDEAGRTAINMAQDSGYDNIVFLLRKAELRRGSFDQRYKISSPT
ncbi:hypothetical protein BKA70DRAFT_1341522 [Coprinopsis sp. MPI-PUGE-AT-0042]|nr:hypothetical protein BKA70DRAFT_1341522 [Coprinopsis sp. MPI-PUGE-AT-0042]